MFFINVAVSAAIFIIVVGALIPDRVLVTMTLQSQKTFWICYFTGLLITLIYLGYLGHNFTHPKTNPFF